MKHNSLTSFVLLPVCFLLFSACGDKHDDAKPNSKGDLYIATPEKMMNLAGSPWSAAKPDLDDKKGYWYTDLSGDGPSPATPFKAAVSLPAIEETDHSIGYTLSFNTSLDVETVLGVELETDTLTRLSFAQANALMLAYYNRSLPFTGDTSFTGASYTEPGGLDGTGVRRSTVAGVVDMLTRSVAEDAYSMQVNGTDGSFWLAMSKNPDGVSYYFTCQSF